MLTMTQTTFYTHSTNGLCICANRETSNAPMATDSVTLTSRHIHSIWKKSASQKPSDPSPPPRHPDMFLIRGHVSRRSRAARLVWVLQRLIAHTDRPHLRDDFGTRAETATLERCLHVIVEYAMYAGRASADEAVNNLTVWISIHPSIGRAGANPSYCLNLTFRNLNLNHFN